MHSKHRLLRHSLSIQHTTNQYTSLPVTYAHFKRHKNSLALSKAKTQIQEIMDRANTKVSTDPNYDFRTTNMHYSILRRIFRAQSPSELHKLIQLYEPQYTRLRRVQYCDPRIFPSPRRVYSEGIRRLTALNEESEGWKLFKTAKDTKNICAGTYAAIMLHVMQFDRSPQGLHKAFELFYEYINEQSGIPTALLDAALIDCCCKVNEFDKGYEILDKIKQNRNSIHLLSKQVLCQSIAKLYIKSGNIRQGLLFLFDIYKAYRLIPNVHQCAVVMHGIVDEMHINMDAEDKRYYLRYAEKLFDFAFTDRASPKIKAYNAYIRIYAKIGEYEACKKFVQCMVENEMYPMPNVNTFKFVMSAFVFYNYENVAISEMEMQAQKECIDGIKGLMQTLEIQMDSELQCALMDIAKQHFDLQGMYEIYKGIRDKTCSEVRLLVVYIGEMLQNIKRHNIENIDLVAVEQRIQEMKPVIVRQYQELNALPVSERQSDNEKFEKFVNEKLA